MYWGRAHIYLLAALAGGGLQEAWCLGAPDRGHSKGPGRQDFADSEETVPNLKFCSQVTWRPTCLTTAQGPPIFLSCPTPR